MNAMKISRRMLIGTALAAPVVAMAPVRSLGAPVIENGPKLPPVEPDWKWWAGDGEHYGDSFSTFEQAMEFARREGCSTVIRAHQDVLYCPLDFTDEDVFRAMERAEDGTNEPGLSEDGDAFERVGEEDINDLVRRLNAAADAWFHEREINKKLQVYYFQGVANETKTKVAPAPEMPV